jgi:hypothetical protein
MIGGRNSSQRTHLRRRNFGMLGATLALLALGLVLCPGCDDAVAKEFRTAAIGKVETGVNDLVSGLLDGLFTVAEPSSTGG